MGIRTPAMQSKAKQSHIDENRESTDHADDIDDALCFTYIIKEPQEDISSQHVDGSEPVSIEFL